jgi:hypothetical protein
MISFRRSISCALERCSSNSLCCAITSAVALPLKRGLARACSQ